MAKKAQSRSREARRAARDKSVLDHLTSGPLKPTWAKRKAATANTTLKKDGSWSRRSTRNGRLTKAVYRISERSGVRPDSSPAALSAAPPPPLPPRGSSVRWSLR